MFKKVINRIARYLIRKPLPKSSQDIPTQDPRQPSGQRFIFVGGSPRSGTTLVQHLLDSHRDIFGGPEFDCIPGLINSWQTVLAAWSLGRIKSFCSQEQIASAFGRLIEDLLLPVADSHGAKFLSEKTPFNVLVFPKLLELFPACKLVHVVRDPRGVVASMMKVRKRILEAKTQLPDFLQSAATATEFTLHCQNAGFAASERAPHRVFTLSYENLVKDPEDSIRQLCEFLGLPVDPNMFEQHNREHPGLKETLKLDDGTWLDHSLGFRRIEASRISVWKDDLTSAEVEFVNRAAGENEKLKALGYSFEQMSSKSA